MAPEVFFSLLGPLKVNVGQRAVTITAGRQRTLLAALLASANKVVSIDRLAEFVWDGQPPPTASPTIRTYVMRLRQTLGKTAGERIQTCAPGYLIKVGEMESDLHRFVKHRETANSLLERGDLEGARRELSSALSFWEAPLVDIPSMLLQDEELHYWRKLHMQTLLSRLDVDIEIGRYDAVIPELWRIVRDDSTHEPMVARLMLALHRSGHRAEALRLFRDTRSHLLLELGSEPGPEIQQMRQKIMVAEAPRISNSVRQRTAKQPAGGIIPAQLPSAPADFVGRQQEKALLTQLLDPSQKIPHTSVTVLLTGTSGIGKSALSLSAAHAMRAAFPDGQLHADLDEAPESTSQGRSLSSAPDILTRFLMDLGTPGDEVPDDQARRIGLYRTLLADRKVLVVLDGVTDTTQVRHLLPGSGASRAIVVGRGRFAGLDSARIIRLKRLDQETSLDMLGTLLGRERVDAEPDAARRITSVCAGLPLALRIAAARLMDRDGWSLTDMAMRLSSEGRLLNELQDGERSVRDALKASYATARRHYSCDAPAMDTVLRVVASESTPRIHTARLAAELDCPLEDTELILDELVGMGLLNSPGPGKYVVDELVRAFSREMRTPALPAPVALRPPGECSVNNGFRHPYPPRCSMTS
ncbi:BTAD domain-containing putative transcriptional regulator [Streptomyces sp. 150FB]|uniref:AfsR/SARP family transcriptional regulator n=1 Tax=Streptomyces sp. 150FB TaxID=1576605 RepID=UPI00099B89B0|nr:BTAD domain-containing putative transcriptional regulator [Streptomyces sp. 150FB]